MTLEGTVGEMNQTI